uniref:Uncharacterized protein n=1 Tax=Globodera rostochiensis TaxID=31243 RepID=A0A914HAI2_GLORO
MHRKRDSVWFIQFSSTSSSTQHKIVDACALLFNIIEQKPMSRRDKSKTAGPRQASTRQVRVNTANQPRSPHQPAAGPAPAEPPSRPREDTAVFSAALERFVNETMRRTVPELVNEYTQLNALPRAETSPEFARNMDSNRYRDVVCAEQNRVRLNNERYIHANWINAHNEFRYICTQGPLPTTCDDFWTMIVQENIGAIVMLCDLIEKNYIKCHQYWPTEQSPVMRFANGQIMVKFQSEKHLDGDVYRTDLAVNAPQMRNNYMQVQHFHWRSWPDHGVPRSDLATLRLMFHLHHIERTVVHCSAGIGRTGTLVAIFVAYQTLQRGQQLNFFQLVRSLRQQRAQSVQTLDQYLYIYNAILRYARNKLTTIDGRALDVFLQELVGNMKRS